MEIIVFLIASMFAIVIYNLITTCITIIGWFQKKQHTQGYHTLVDKDIFSCCAKQESFLYDEKFRFCPCCGIEINEGNFELMIRQIGSIVIISLDGTSQLNSSIESIPNIDRNERFTELSQ